MIIFNCINSSNKNICIAGHVDVVPPIGNWQYNPWELTENSGKLYGRGTNYMKIFSNVLENILHIYTITKLCILLHLAVYDFSLCNIFLLN